MKKTILSALTLCIFITSAPCVAQKTTETSEEEPRLSIISGKKIQYFSRSELLQSPALKTLEITKDPAYPEEIRTYKAVPLSSLFQSLRVDPTFTILFKCRDGFSAPINATKALNSDPLSSIAYVAIEEAKSPWPVLKNEKYANTAGPFYLIWEHPEKSKISNEDWPYQLTSFEIKAPIEKQYPNILPKPGLLEKNPIQKGYRAFLKTCFNCHTLNGDGSSFLGPDLNIPFNPTEYFKPQYLEKLVRDPQSLRHWSQSKMTAFDSTTLSNEELKNIILYLQHMSKRKVSR